MRTDYHSGPSVNRSVWCSDPPSYISGPSICSSCYLLKPRLMALCPHGLSRLAISQGH